MRTFYAGKGIYVPIQVDAQDLIVQDSNREALNAIGVQGEIIMTPGHSDDSVSLVLDSGRAFIGDLHRPGFVLDEARQVTCLSWKKLISLNADTIYPAHGNPFHMQDIQSSFENC